MYLATTAVEFERYAREDKCVALLDHGVMMLGMPEGWRDPYLVVPPQAYSQKQLYLLRRVLPFYASVEEAREMFYMKEVKLEDISMQDAVALQAALMELGIDSRVVKD
ncbi:hypothetical protein [Massilia rubra]|uniref:YcgL domain-containing protein n=1 Tax=Massilia rubra TaxID=2607910 RepID=A0ABX0M152_9BURK|nr:hypothetical protein [Massilia rubra]NHZ37354.1 hypothetical protein [Massilia rubra]